MKWKELTRDEIIEMARESRLGASLSHNGQGARIYIEGADWHDEITRFAALVTAEKDAEIARLNDALHWEQSRAERVGTHGPGCWKWGPSHYECALRRIDALEMKGQ